MRYITVPFCWLDEENNVLRTDLRINPFSIDAFHATVLDFIDPEEGVPLSQDITTITTRSGLTYEVLLQVSEVEKLIDNFMRQ
jgi:hypothetical protein